MTHAPIFGSRLMASHREDGLLCHSDEMHSSYVLWSGRCNALSHHDGHRLAYRYGVVLDCLLSSEFCRGRYSHASVRCRDGDVIPAGVFPELLVRLCGLQATTLLSIRDSYRPYEQLQTFSSAGVRSHNVGTCRHRLVRSFHTSDSTVVAGQLQ